MVGRPGGVDPILGRRPLASRPAFRPSPAPADAMAAKLGGAVRTSWSLQAIAKDGDVYK